MHTDMRRTGWFECSDERINRLHEAVVWTLRGNACDIPTDCPTRERAGWTGDWAAGVPSAALLYDIAGFTTKWLRDVAADQRPDGCINYIAPDTFTADEKAVLPAGSAVWGDAAVAVPWEIYRTFGDRQLLEDQWSSMAGWVEYALAQAREHRHPSRIELRPTAAPHEAFIWDTGYHFGERMEPNVEELDLVELGVADPGWMATAYLYRSCCQLSDIASVLGRRAWADRYGELAAATKAAWQVEFIAPDGTLVPDRQPAYVRALAFDLLPEALRPQAAERLVELIRHADMHLGTGLHTTGDLLPVLADTGYLEVAYELLFQDTEPSWLTMIERGATTIWETWDSVDREGRVRPDSLNHFPLATVIEFLHRYVGGIELLSEAPDTGASRWHRGRTIA